MRAATVFNFLVEAELIGSAVMAGVLVVRCTLRRALGARFVRALWLLVVLRLLLPIALPNPLMNALKPTLSVDAGIRPMADQVRTRIGDAAAALYWKASGSAGSPLTRLLRQVSGAARNGRLSWAVLAVYLTGAAAAAAWMLAANARFRARRRPAPLELLDAWREVCARRGLKRVPPLYVADGLPSAVAAGCLRPYVLVPGDAPGEALLCACGQARAHAGFWALLRCLCLCVHWFNPLVWVSAHLSRLDEALACDEWVCAPLSAGEREAYASWLIHQPTARFPSPSVGVAASCAAWRAPAQTVRIRRALHPEPPIRVTLALMSLLAAVTLSLMFLTDEQSSAGYIPALLQPPLPEAGCDLSGGEGAEEYARRFLRLEGVDAGEPAEFSMVTRTEDGWHVTFYLPSGEPCLIAFDLSGKLISYEDVSLSGVSPYPLADPITVGTEEGRAWCTFLEAFLARHFPAVYEDFAAMNIARSGRVDGEEFLTVELLDERGETRYTIDLQVAPVGRIYRFVSY